MRRFIVSTLWAVSCASAPPPAPVVSDDEAVRGAAHTFLECYERDGAECRAEDAPVMEWSGVAALALVRDGIPTEIQADLPKLLDGLRDEHRVRRDLVQTLTDNQRFARTGACDVRRIDVVGPRAVELGKAAAARIERLGLDGTPAGDEIVRLADAMQTVAGARVVRTDCPQTHGSFYLVFAQNENKAWRLVALYPAPPMWFRLEAEPPQPTGRVRVLSPGENLIDPWIPVYEEQL